MQDYKEQILGQYASMQPTDYNYILIEDDNKAHGAKNDKKQNGIKRG